MAINEIITAVTIALGNQALDTCPEADFTGDLRVTINELITFVNNALTPAEADLALCSSPCPLW